jgi:maleamate amidohydrolase
MSATTLSDVSGFENYCWRDVVPPELLTIYAPYRRPRKIPDRPCLLVLHPVPGVPLTAQPEWETPASRLLIHVRAAGIPVLHSLPPNGSPAAMLVPKSGEPMIARPFDSAFMCTDLAPTLIRSRVSGLLLCGATASGALRATAVEAKSYAYKAAVAEETTADEASLLYKLALFDVAHKYADVMSLDEMLELLRRGADVVR